MKQMLRDDSSLRSYRGQYIVHPVTSDGRISARQETNSTDQFNSPDCLLFLLNQTNWATNKGTMAPGSPLRMPLAPYLCMYYPMWRNCVIQLEGLSDEVMQVDQDFLLSRLELVSTTDDVITSTITSTQGAILPRVPGRDANT